MLVSRASANIALHASSQGKPSKTFANTIVRHAAPTPRASYTRSWTGITAEVIELQGPGPYLENLRSEKPRLIVVLEKIGGRVETRLAPDCPAVRCRGPNNLVFIPPATSVWEYAERFHYIRRIAIDFDTPPLVASDAEVASFQLRFVRPLGLSNGRLWSLADLLADECSKPCSIDQAYGDSLSLVIFHNLLKLAEAEHEGATPRKLMPRQLRFVTEYMEQRSFESVQLKELAKMIGLSQGYFSRAFKASTGMTPLRWLLTARIGRAQQILLETGQSLADVALATGFADQSHFTRSFRTIAGDSPGAWRRNHKAPRALPVEQQSGDA